jgi:hypothetical protein
LVRYFKKVVYKIILSLTQLSSLYSMHVMGQLENVFATPLAVSTSGDIALPSSASLHVKDFLNACIALNPAKRNGASSLLLQPFIGILAGYQSLYFSRVLPLPFSLESFIIL